ncbi:MAG: TIM-barrel domain-containing protein [Bacteroidota bacterium]
MIKIYLSILLFLLWTPILSAQIVVIDPEDATTDSDIVLTYNAALGNGHLEGFTGDVYMYTGVITDQSSNDSDWRYVQSNWGTPNPNTLMTSLGDDLYQIAFNIREFYGIPLEENVLKLAMLFTNADYSLVGRTETGGDIFVEINRQTAGDYVAHGYADQKLSIETNQGQYEVSFFTPSMVKTEFIPINSEAMDTTFTVSGLPAVVDVTIAESDEGFSLSSSDLEVFVPKFPVRSYYIVGSDTILSEEPGFSTFPQGGSVAFSSEPEEKFYGGGSRAIPINRKGRNLLIRNEAHYGYSNNAPTLNIAIPFVISDKGYGLFFDNRFIASLDLGNSNAHQTIYSTPGGRLRYYFMAGNTPGEVLENYTYLTGRQKLPPLWALGYIQSKYGYENQTQAVNIVNQIREEDFPLDALILDLYWFGTTNDMGNLDWDYSRWPQPVQMINDFSSLGVETILITEPYFTLNSVNYPIMEQNQFLATNSEGDPFILWGFWAGDAALMDMTNPLAREWMWDFYQARKEEGVGGWWCDLGEPEAHPDGMNHQMGNARSVHNVYSLLWAEFLHQKYEEHYPQERLFNLIRSGYAGLQRYSAFPWSGDIQRSFEGLRSQIPIMLGAGMSGLGYMHSDVGGFVGNDNDAELFTRWVQLGVFAPVLRLHGIGTTEPVAFPDPYKDIMRRYIKLRYQMLPYNYTLAYENSLNGSPLARQLNYYEPGNQFLADVNDAYLWGKDFLVAPVLERSVSQRLVHFPAGRWLDYHTMDVYEGNQSYTVACTMNDIPLFVKAGSFIPMARPVSSTKYYSTDSLVVQYFPDDQIVTSSGYMYADDGHSASSLHEQAFQLLHFEGQQRDDGGISITLSQSGNGFEGMPENRNMLFEIFRMDDNPGRITIDGVEIPEVESVVAFNDHPQSWYYHAQEKLLLVNTQWGSNSQVIEIFDATLSSSAIHKPQAAQFLLHHPYPNPFGDFLKIDADVVKPGDYIVELTDMRGVTWYRATHTIKEVGPWQFVLPATGRFPSGMYFLTVRNGIDKQSRKVMKLP